MLCADTDCARACAGIARDENGRLRNHEINRDGWGIGWFDLHRRPHHIVSRTAAVDALNATSPELEHTARKVDSSALFGHVRACSGSRVSELNSHPFVFGPLLFM